MRFLIHSQHILVLVLIKNTLIDLPVSISFYAKHRMNNDIIIIIIIIINCNWFVTLWQWLFYMYTKYEIGY